MGSHPPEAWLRTPGLLRLATALLHQNRPSVAAILLQGGAKRRTADGVPPAVDRKSILSDPATGELLGPLRALVNERLAKAPRDAALLELRAELAGQWSDAQAQVADYTAAIEALAQQKPEATAAGLKRLYVRRGNAHVALGQWQQAVDDYARGMSDKVADVDLLSKRARAHEALNNWDAAAADWSRAASGNPDGANLLGEFARRLAAADQRPLANAQFEKSEALYERSLQAYPENDMVAGDLARLLFDKEADENPTRWAVLKPSEMKSKGGATLSKLPDESILASGKNSLGDAYTIVAQTQVTQVRAIRLEALTHESLPNQGPGRSEPGFSHGNFAMVKFTITAHIPGTEPRPIEVSRVAADHYFLELTANHWNIWSGPSGSHTAVYLAKQPVDCRDGTRLEFRMEFSDDAGWSLQNLGRFRLSVASDPAAFDREQTRCGLMKLGDPWAKLAVAYAVNGRNDEATRYFTRAIEQSLGREARRAILELAAHFGDLLPALIERQPDEPQLQAGLARHFAARGNAPAANAARARACALFAEKLAQEPENTALAADLLLAYQSAGRTREAVPYLAKASAADPSDMLLLQVAALQAWFGQEQELAATRQRILAFAKDTNDSGTAERAAKACSIRASTNKAELNAALALARKGVEFARGSEWREWRLLALGMAEYRSGNRAAATQALLAAAKAGSDNPIVTGISAFYRAMSLSRQGKSDEARQLAIGAAAKLKPLPKDEQNPLANNAYYDDLILWLAYKEAKAMIHFDAATAAPETPDGK